MAQFVGVGASMKQESSSIGNLTPYAAAAATTMKPEGIASYQTAANLANGLAVVPPAPMNGLALNHTPVGLAPTSLAGGAAATYAASAVAAAAAAANGLPGSRGNSPSRQDAVSSVGKSVGDVIAPTSGSGPIVGHQSSQGGSNSNAPIVTTVNGQVSDGIPQPSGQQQLHDPPPNKLFVGGLSWQTTTDKLRDYFSAYGTVTDVLIMKDPITQRSRGFGFITFQDAVSVDKVLQVTHHMLDGKKIDPKHATPRNAAKKPGGAGAGLGLGLNGYPGDAAGSNQAASTVAAAANGTLKTKKIFVGGLSQETTVEEIKQYFSQFGGVEEAVLLMDNQTKRHRGFGFVTMASETAVDRICDIHFHVIKAKKVECKKALPREAVAAATAAAAAAQAQAVAQQPSLAYILARQRLAAQAVAANSLVPGAFGGAGVQLGPGPPSPALLQLFDGFASQQAAAAAAAATQAMLPSAPPTGAPPSASTPVVTSAQLTPGVSAPSSYGKVLAYQGASSAYRFDPIASQRIPIFFRYATRHSRKLETRSTNSCPFLVVEWAS